MSLLKLLRPFSLVVTLAAVGACGGSSQSAAVHQPKATPTASADPSCPVTVPGTSVAVEDTNTGAALVFVTTSDVAELRKRVATMAKMHNDQHGSMGPLPDGNAPEGGHAGHDMSAGHDMGGGGGEHAGHDMSGAGKHAGHAGGMIGVHSKAAASDVEGGAKIEFTSGGADVAKLQGELRMHAQHFSSGSCEMGKH